MVSPLDSEIALSDLVASMVSSLDSEIAFSDLVASIVSPLDSEIALSDLVASIVSPLDSEIAFSDLVASMVSPLDSEIALSDLVASIVSPLDSAIALSATPLDSDAFAVLGAPIVSTTILLSILPEITLVASLSIIMRAVIGAVFPSLESALREASTVSTDSALPADAFSDLVASMVSPLDSEIALSDLVASMVSPWDSKIALSAFFAFAEPIVSDVTFSPFAVITLVASASSKI